MINEIIAILFVGLSGITIAIHYRTKYKKYRQLYEGTQKPKSPAKPKLPIKQPHMSEKAIQARMNLQHYLEIRSQILLRDNFRCRECNFYKHLEVHHIIPRSKGGTDDPKNLITLCQRCHAKKHGFKHRENKRVKHAKRNRRKKFRRYLNKEKHRVREMEIPITSLEDVHPRQEDHSLEAETHRRRLYEKWQHNELNQTNHKPDSHD